MLIINIKKNLLVILKTKQVFKIIICLSTALFFDKAYCQTEVAPWGNIKGIRVGGQLMEFESSLRVIGKNWTDIISTGRERQKPKYVRDANKQIITTSIDSLAFNEVVEDSASGIANVNIRMVSKSDRIMEGIFFCIELPFQDYSHGSIQFINAKGQTITNNKLTSQNSDQKFTVNKIKFISVHRQLELSFDLPTLIIIKKDLDKTASFIEIYFPIWQGDIQNGSIAEKNFTIKTSGFVDKNKITLKIDTSKSGRAFDGLGGNFRLQNAKTDPQVIDYCLQNLRVAWSRVEMPWRFWQPEKDTDPTDEAKADKLHPNVLKAMEMAQRLNKMDIPIILSAWFPPKWAIVGAPNFRHENGVWGNPLDTSNMNAIYKSITDYILYLKNIYGVEIKLFSFNESDLGINIRQTGEEHAALIKGLGKYFLSKGLTTKMLLGDNSDATTYDFIYPAMNDNDARKYVGAISFHSWRGWEKETLQKWADAAKQLDVPLIVGEGSIDAAAWNYPAVFEEQTYALEEINLYTRLLSICEPLSILQWQLTADYSPLAGGGIFGNDEPLYPTQRFWNLKQLASTPKGLFAMPVGCDRPYVSCAALGNKSTGIYTLHIVNNGAGREVNLTGLPKKIKSLQIYTTDKNLKMKESITTKLPNGEIHFHVKPTSYTTLITQ